MDTNSPNDSLGAALFGKTRRSVLSLLYSHTDEAFYLRQLARAAGVGLGAVQREVKRLSEAGIIQRTGRGQHVYFQANPQCPLFEELRSLVVKTSGMGDVLRSALTLLASRIRVAFIYGSVAHRAEQRDSDVDVMVVGDVTFGEVVSALGPAQEILGREINPTVYPPGEFRSKLGANHHFLKSVVRGSKLFLIGDERELASVAEQPLAGGASDQSPGDRRSVRRGRP